ncbi:MAG TPA: hypothetical protein PLK12_08740, partial [Prolixibacteraceae bacterium]|nr:hypothetical protein [Prolixibacteraceae bacterium]
SANRQWYALKYPLPSALADGLKGIYSIPATVAPEKSLRFVWPEGRLIIKGKFRVHRICSAL